MSTSYQVHMDYEGFRELFLAQQGGYTRKLGVLCAVVCGVLGAFGLAAVAGGRHDMLLSDVVLLACAAFGLLMAVWPSAVLSTRGGLVRAWFAERGSMDTQGKITAISCDYTVELDDRGFTELAGSNTIRTAWYELSDRPRAGERGTYFVRSKGRDDSVLYNLMGINWALRDEAVSGVLFIPNEVTRENEGLVEEVRGRIAAARQERVGSRGERV